MIEKANEIIKKSYGAKYYCVNLHVHTPYSEDWNDLECTPEDFVKKAINSGYDLIAITDHNGTGWCDLVRAAAKKIASETEHKLVVLPGVEIYARGGVHVLAIFEKDTPTDNIKKMLAEMGIHEESKGNCNLMTSEDYTIDNIKVLKKIVDFGGLAILPHIVGNKRGFWDAISGQTRMQILNSGFVRVLSVKNGKLPEQLRMNNSDFKYQFAVINDSDVHKLDDFNDLCTKTWIKMDSCDLNGIKQIIFEPILNLCINESIDKAYPQIIGMSIDGGHFDNTIFRFNKNLNCIIGGRGAGKSIIIDLLRFVFNKFPKSEEVLERYSYRLADLLKEGNSVFVVVEAVDKKKYIIKRSLNVEINSPKGSKPKYHIKNSPIEIFEIKETPIPIIKSLDELINPEIFGQGEVLELTKKLDEQIHLIDDFIAIRAKLHKEDEILMEIESKEDEILNEYILLQENKEKMDTLPELKRYKATLDVQLSDDIFQKYKYWQDEKICLDKIKETIEKFLVEVNRQDFSYTKFPEVEIDKTPNPSIIENCEKIIKKCIKELETIKITLQNDISSAKISIYNLDDNWSKLYAQEEKLYQQKLKELGSENLKHLSDKQKEINEQIFELENETKDIYEKIIGNIVKLETEYEEKLQDLINIRDEISNDRERGANVITSKMSGGIKVELKKQEDYRNYYSILSEILSAGIKSKETQIEKIATNISYKDLCKLIWDNKIDEVMERSGITRNTAEKLFNIFESKIDNEGEIKGKSSKKFFKLQRTKLIDVPTIFLKEEDVFKPLENLSIGQVCSAVLSLALLQKERPLIIDQPEDELDHAYIMNDIVEKFVAMKDKRQFIVATHNQNIPVLGNSEHIFKVRKISGRENCEIEQCGGIENMLDKIIALEGGKEAFLRRKEKYQLF